MSEYSQEAINKVDAYLEHYGVKGMKWGHHKAKKETVSDVNKKSSASGAATGIAVKKVQEDKKKEREEVGKRWSEANYRNALSLDMPDETRKKIEELQNNGWTCDSVQRNVSDEYIKIYFYRNIPNPRYGKPGYVDSRLEFLTEYEYVEIPKNKVKHDSLDEDYISHHGILGQKWGVKHGPPYPLDSKTAKRVAGQKVTVNIRDLSDEDLKKIVQRLNMEKQLKDLTKDQKSKGKKFGDKAIDKLGDTTLNIIFGAAESAGKKYLTKKIEDALKKASP